MKLRLILAAAALTGLSLATQAQHSHGAKPTTQAAAAELAEGEIRRVDAAKGTALIKHGEIKNLGMSPMTMGFKFKDPAMAAGLQAGDKIKFAAEQKGEELLITQIRKVN